MPLALVTNDDGINSCFLHKLVKELQKEFSVIVAAPKKEQSWIGRAFSRHSKISVEKFDGLNCPAWSIDGTPSDCVNIALGHLVDQQPDIVISGINIGYNTSLPLILSSGTVAGAIEGATWGYPSLALSQFLSKEYFELVSQNNSEMPQNLKDSLSVAAKHATQLALSLLQKENKRLTVNNLNYPFPLIENTECKETVPVDILPGNLISPDEDGNYSFKYMEAIALPNDKYTDRQCLEEGYISHSVLNFSGIAEK